MALAQQLYAVPSRSLGPTSRVIKRQPGGEAKIAFVSGHLDPSPQEFNTHYVALLDKALASGHRFVMGAAAGVDTLALTYLFSRGAPAQDITVYLHRAQASAFRPKLTDFEAKGGHVVVVGRNHAERDEACTRASHYDILRYRTEEEAKKLYGKKYRSRVSGTQKNEMRRKSGIGLVWLEEDDEKVASLDEGGNLEGKQEEDENMRAVKKRVRALERKIRDTKVLQERIDNGEVLEQTQITKAGRLDEWVKELDEMTQGSQKSQ